MVVFDENNHFCHGSVLEHSRITILRFIVKPMCNERHYVEKNKYEILVAYSERLKLFLKKLV